MSNLLQRTFTALVALPLLVLVVIWQEPLGFALLVVAVAAAALREYTELALTGPAAVERAVTVLTGLALAAGVYLRPDRSLVLTASALSCLALAAAVFPRPIEGAFSRWSACALGTFYIGLLIPSLPLLQRDVPDGRRWVVAALGVTFANDTAAYFTGRAVGRHRLAPLISPGKTVEGAVGGLLAGVAFLFAFREGFLPALTPLDCVALGIGAGVLGPAGDLFESLIKRSAGVKDSGSLFPGHGGVLDRIDALLFVGTFVYLYAAHR